ncbi:hypothetical protein ABZ249_04865 [Nocardiopsis sp. NPDC006139]|uniref:hypothetical protein n=1 Tax=Nocardiopsis sp. NPDC006139 TaxID=3154578 RepID=UPI0033B9A4EB
MALLLCILAGALVFTRSVRRILDHGLDVPEALTRLEAERARTEASLAALGRAEALLNEAASSAANGAAAAAALERADRELAAYPAEGDRAAEAVAARLPGRHAAARLARVADFVLAAAGAALVVVGGVLGFVLIP